jgi:hypothetical protein
MFYHKGDEGFSPRYTKVLVFLPFQVGQDMKSQGNFVIAIGVAAFGGRNPCGAGGA